MPYLLPTLLLTIYVVCPAPATNKKEIKKERKKERKPSPKRYKTFAHDERPRYTTTTATKDDSMMIDEIYSPF